MLTSGAYMVAVAADKILVNPATLTGSIGVFQQSFGIKELADKAGISARCSGQLIPDSILRFSSAATGEMPSLNA